ncbi:retrovirus-related pol polyprotein from transposon TNT 1-94 [Tanacetum coccineum]
MVKLKSKCLVVLPCVIGNTTVSNAIDDLGASISVMLFSMFKRLGLGNPKLVNMVIEMVDGSMQSPKGIVENVLEKTHMFIFPIDFIILDVIEDDKVPIIMGRPMLATTYARIDVFRGKISLEVGTDTIVFNANERANPPTVSSRDRRTAYYERDSACKSKGTRAVENVIENESYFSLEVVDQDLSSLAMFTIHLMGGSGGGVGSSSRVGEGKDESMGGIGCGSFAIHSMVVKDGLGGDGLVVEGGRSPSTSSKDGDYGGGGDAVLGLLKQHGLTLILAVLFRLVLFSLGNCRRNGMTREMDQEEQDDVLFIEEN